MSKIYFILISVNQLENENQNHNEKPFHQYENGDYPKDGKQYS